MLGNGFRLDKHELGSQIQERKSMKKAVELSPFVLLSIGTIGLLANEYIFDWGKAATLIFAAANVTGLLILGYPYWMRKKDK